MIERIDIATQLQDSGVTGSASGKSNGGIALQVEQQQRRQGERESPFVPSHGCSRIRGRIL